MSAPEELPVSTYARRTVERVTESVRQPEQDVLAWHVTFVLGVLSDLDVRGGHGDAIREACDRLAKMYDVPAERDLDRYTTPVP